MIYKITVPEMHCSGCDALMKLTLEDDFSNIQPDHQNHTIKFESDKNVQEVEVILNRLFEEFKGSDVQYSYKDITKLD